MDSSKEDTQKKLDKALKRNQIKKEENQEVKPSKTESNEIPVEEPITDEEEQIDE